MTVVAAKNPAGLHLSADCLWALPSQLDHSRISAGVQLGTLATHNAKLIVQVGPDDEGNMSYVSDNRLMYTESCRVWVVAQIMLGIVQVGSLLSWSSIKALPSHLCVCTLWEQHKDLLNGSYTSGGFLQFWIAVRVRW